MENPIRIPNDTPTHYCIPRAPRGKCGHWKTASLGLVGAVFGLSFKLKKTRFFDISGSARQKLESCSPSAQKSHHRNLMESWIMGECWIQKTGPTARKKRGLRSLRQAVAAAGEVRLVFWIYTKGYAREQQTKHKITIYMYIFYNIQLHTRYITWFTKCKFFFFKADFVLYAVTFFLNFLDVLEG